MPTRRPSRHAPPSPRPITRREFFAESGALAALLAAGVAPAIHLPHRKRYDLIIRRGVVFDGSGRPGFEADLGLTDGRIAALAPTLGGDARRVIDARGLAVAPGFIDIHSHADGTLFRDPHAESVIRQGVTTVVIGQDGSSRAPSRRDGAASRSIGDVLRTIEELPPAVNVATMVGLGTVRHVVVGDDDRPATETELREMAALVDAALAAGACGASSGLEYTPGAFASRQELIALCRPLAARGLPYATHMRNEDDELLEAIDEAIAVARGAGCPLQISHLKTQGARNWAKIDAALARIEDAKRSGLDVAFDRYPYLAYQTGLSNLFPDWTGDGGTDAFLARLRDSTQTPALRAAVHDKIALLGGWDNVLISSVTNDADRAAEGERLGAYARARGDDPYEMVVELLTRSGGNVGMVGFAMSEENLVRFLAHPLGMVCSDGGAYATEGPARVGHPHPRSLGTFPRILARYVRERHALTMPQAIHKMTAFPASRLRLADRGRLARGLAADVVVFDPATVRDRATFAEPFQYPEGIHAVVVNGQVALLDGHREDARSGRGLHPRPPDPR